MQITITMTTGNAEFETPRDVAKALIALAKRIERDGSFENVTKVMDENGNAVGKVEVQR